MGEPQYFGAQRDALGEVVAVFGTIAKTYIKLPNSSYKSSSIFTDIYGAQIKIQKYPSSNPPVVACLASVTVQGRDRWL